MAEKIMRSGMKENNELVKAVIATAREIDGREKLSCADAFELARKFGAEIIEIGRICDEENIRICKCQLGCFA